MISQWNNVLGKRFFCLTDPHEEEKMNWFQLMHSERCFRGSVLSPQSPVPPTHTHTNLQIIKLPFMTTSGRPYGSYSVSSKAADSCVLFRRILSARRAGSAGMGKVLENNILSLASDVSESGTGETGGDSTNSSSSPSVCVYSEWSSDAVGLRGYKLSSVWLLTFFVSILKSLSEESLVVFTSLTAVEAFRLASGVSVFGLIWLFETLVTCCWPVFSDNVWRSWVSLFSLSCAGQLSNRCEKLISWFSFSDS